MATTISTSELVKVTEAIVESGSLPDAYLKLEAAGADQSTLTTMSAVIALASAGVDNPT